MGSVEDPAEGPAIRLVTLVDFGDGSFDSVIRVAPEGQGNLWTSKTG